MYSNYLIEKVKRLYPTSTQMHTHAEKGSEMLGRYLNDSITGTISVDTILKATSLEELQEEARIEKEKVELYIRWRKEAKVLFNYPQ